jgi:hypothetical protein
MKQLKDLLNASLWQDYVNTESSDLPSYTRRLYGQFNRPEYNSDDIARAVSEVDKWFYPTRDEMMKVNAQMAGDDDDRRWPVEYLINPNAGLCGYSMQVLFDKRVVKKMLGLDSKKLYKILTQNFDDIKVSYEGWSMGISSDPKEFEKIHNTIVNAFTLHEADITKFQKCLAKLEVVTQKYAAVLKSHSISPERRPWDT